MKYISCPILIGIMFFVTGCKTGLDVDRLPLDEDFVQDARVAFFEADRTGVITDYAQVDPGGATSDGFAITENTDADGIMSAATGAKERLFIQLPASEARRDHILRAIAAASIREDLKKGDRWNLLVLNTKKIKSNVATYGFDDTKAKAYFLSIARRLNDQKLSSNDIIIVNIDEFPFGLTPDEFFNVLSDPHIVALSSQGVDTVKTFDNKEESGEFFSKGLNPGHIYKLVKARLLRSKNIKDKAQQEATSLIIAKVITALEPNGNLGSLAKFFTLIDPIVDGTTTPADLQKEIMQALAQFFQANYDYLVQLQLDTKTLSAIHNEVKQNTMAFNEQARKTDEIFKDMKKIVASGFATLGDTVARGFRATRSSLDDIRNNAIPELEQTLIDSGDRNRDEVMNATSRSVNRGVKQLTDEGAKQHIESRKELVKKFSALAADLEQAVSQRAREHMMELTTTFVDRVNAMLRKLQAENALTASKTVRDINNATMNLLRKAVATLSEHTTTVGETTALAVHDDATKNTDALKAQTRAVSASAIADITKAVGDRIAQSQKTLTRSMANTVSESESAVTKSLLAESSDIRDALLVAVKRILTEQKAALTSGNKDINEHTSAVLKRTERLLADALTQAQDEIKGRVAMEHDNTRAEIAANTSKSATKTASRVTEQNAAQHGVTRTIIARKVQDQIDDAQAQIDKVLNQQSQEVKDLVAQTIARAMGQLKSSMTDLSGGINTHTTSTVKQTQNILSNALMQAEEELKQRVLAEGQLTRDEGNTTVKKSVARASAEVIAQLRQAITNSEAALRAHVTTTVNDAQANLANAIKRARSALSDALVQTEEEIKRSVSEDGQLTRDDTAGVKKAVTRISADALVQLRQAIAASEAALKGYTALTVSDAQNEIVQRVSEDGQLTRDDTAGVKKAVMRTNADALVQLRQAIAATEAALKGHTTTTVNDAQANLANAIKRARGALNDALGQTEDEIKRHVAEDGQLTRDDTAGVKKAVTRSSADALVQLRQAIAATEAALKGYTALTVSDAQNEIVQRVSEDGQLTRDDTAGLKKAVTQASADAQKNITDALGSQVNSVIKRAQDAVIDRVQDSESVVTKHIKAEANETRDTVRASARSNRVALRDELTRLIIEEHSDTRRMVTKRGEESAQTTRDVVTQAINNRADDIIHRIEMRVLKAMSQLLQSNRDESSTIVKTLEGVLKKDGKVTRDDMERLSEATDKLVREKAEEVLNQTVASSRYVRSVIGKIVQTLSTDFLFFYSYLRELTRVVALADDVPLGNINKGLNQIRASRLTWAADAALINFKAGNDAGVVRDAALLAYSKVIPGLPKAASGDAQNAIKASQFLLDIVNNYRALASMNEAPRVDMPLLHDTPLFFQSEQHDEDQNNPRRDGDEKSFNVLPGEVDED